VQAALADPIASEQEFLGDIPTVLSGSRLLQPVSEAPVAMSIIDRATIEATGLRTITDLFRLVPGMFVRPAIGVDGVVAVVSYHGLTDENARRMQVLIDGRSVYMPPFSTVLWDDLAIAIDDIDHIEVTRGPNAASDGANAFFGTINIVTRTPVAGEGAYAQVRSGARGVRDAVVRDIGADGRLSYRVTAGHKAEDGFVNLFDSQHHDFLTGRADFDADAANSLQAQLGYSAGQRGLGSAASAIDRPRMENIEDTYAQIKWQQTRAANEESSLQYYYERHMATESLVSLPLSLPGSPAQTYSLYANYRFDRHNLEWVHVTNPLESLRLVMGAGANVEEVASPIYFGGKSLVSSNFEQLFGHAEWRAAAWLLQSGAMLERTSIDGIQVSPRASATYHLDDHQSLRASVSRATRTPSIFEAQGNYSLALGSLNVPLNVSGGGLHSEEIMSAELGYHASEIEGRLQGDLKVYRDHASSLIEQTSNPAVPVIFEPVVFSKNLGDAHITGAELEVHYQAGPVTRFVFSYANTLITANQPGDRRTMPRSLLAIAGQQRFAPDWTAGFGFYLNGSLPAQTGIYGQNNDVALPYEHRIDAHVSRTWSAMGAKATFTVGVEGLGPDFVEFHPYTTFTQRAYVEFSARQ